MAITKSGTSVVTTTSGGTGSSISLSGDYAQELYLSITENGTRTTAATAKVQWSPDGGTNWWDGPTYSGPTTATTTTPLPIQLPITASAVRLVVTVGSGGTSTASTIAYQVGQVTAV